MIKLTDQFSKISVVKKWHGSEQAKTEAIHSEASIPETEMVLRAVAKLGSSEASSKAASDAVTMLMNDRWHENSFEVLAMQLTLWFQKMHDNFQHVETLGLGLANPMANVEFTLLEKQAPSAVSADSKSTVPTNIQQLH